MRQEDLNVPLIGESPAFLDVLTMVSRVAPLNRPVLVIGERGTGKELIAQRLHYLSNRWDKPFYQLNCAALPDTLIEAELFGHEAGAFTGAQRRRTGRFEAADGGTLFLDEIANAPEAVQEKILRVVEYGVFERVGGVEPIRVDVRLVAATNVDLPARAAAGTFRADLLDRLAFDVITLPPLRARAEDITALAELFALGMTRELGRPVFPGFTEEAMERLLSYRWPGNVRELKNVIERAVYRHDDPDTPIDDLILDPFDSPWRPGKDLTGQPEDAVPQLDTSSTQVPSGKPARNRQAPAATVPSGPYDFNTHIAATEKGLLSAALAANDHNQRRTADYLGMGYHALRNQLKKHGLIGGRTTQPETRPDDAA